MRAFLSACLALSVCLSVTAAARAQDGYRWVAAPAFEDAGSAQDGVVPLKQGGSWGLMGRDGQWVLAPQFDAMGAQGFGRFAASRGGLWGVVDTSGAEVLPFRHEAIGTPDLLTPVRLGGRWLLVAEDGRALPEPLAFDTLIGNEGACITGTIGGVPVADWRGPEPKVTRIDAASRIAAPSEGKIRVEVSGRWAVLYCGNPTLVLGTDGFAPTELLEDARRISFGMGAVRRDGLWGFDTHGIYHVEPIATQFAAAREFSEGLAPVQVPGGKWGYINPEGEMVIPPRFDVAFGHSDGIAGVRMGDLRGFVDLAGNMVIAPAFEDYWRHSGGAIPVRQGGLWGVIAPDAGQPETRLALPLPELAARIGARRAPISIVPSTPHFYFGQDVQSRHDVVFSADGKVMLTVLTGIDPKDPGEVALWDRESRKLIRKIPVAGLAQAVLLPGTEILVAGTRSGEIVLLDAVTGEALHRLPGSGLPVAAMAVSPDGTRLASLGGGWLRLWSLPEGRLSGSFRAPEQVLAFAADGQGLWLGDNRGGLRRLSPEGRTVERVAPESLGSRSQHVADDDRGPRPDLALAPTGVLARVASRLEQQPDGFFASVVSFEITTPQGRRSIPLAEPAEVMAVDLSADGTRLAYGEVEGGFWSILDLASGARVLGADRAPDDGGLVWVDRLRFTPDDGLILVGGEGGDIREVSARTGDAVATYGAPLALAVASLALPDGRDVYATDGTGTVLRWDMALGRLAQSARTEIASGVETYLGTDGQVIAVINGYDDSDAAALALGTLMPVDASAATGMMNRALVDGYGRRAPVDGIVQARLSALPGQSEYTNAIPLGGGRFGLISQTVGEHRLYDLATGALAATFLASPDGEWLVLTPEGFFAASENGAALVSVSDGLRSFAVDQVFQALYRPDLVQAKLAGDPDGKLRAAAAELDLTVVLGSGPAPRLRLSFPLPGARATAEMIEAGVDLTDEGGGIGRVEWRVNGLTADISARGAEALGADAQLTARLALEPGRNLIEVVAYNAAGLIASAPQQVVVEWDGQGATGVPALHVLSVGVNEYEDGRLRLAYAAADARALADALARAGAGVFSSVNVVTLLDGQVTDAGLDAAFNDLSGKVKATDVFVFFLAGHGKTVEGEYHFIPADFRFQGADPVREHGIAQARWQEWMARIRARKSVMIYDTCESGSLTNTRGLEAALQQSAAVERLTRAMGRTILSASTDDAPALEGYRGHGVMTYALLSALESGDSNGNATIEVTELAAFIDEKVPEFSTAAFGYRQVPQMSIKGSDFALGAPVAVLGGAVEVFPKILTHVVAAGTGISETAGGAEVQTIPEGGFFGVYRIEERDGFARISREGRALGWVPTAALTPLQ